MIGNNKKYTLKKNVKTNHFGRENFKNMYREIGADTYRIFSWHIYLGNNGKLSAELMAKDAIPGFTVSEINAGRMQQC